MLAHSPGLLQPPALPAPPPPLAAAEPEAAVRQALPLLLLQDCVSDCRLAGPPPVRLAKTRASLCCCCEELQDLCSTSEHAASIDAVQEKAEAK